MSVLPRKLIQVLQSALVLAMLVLPIFAVRIGQAAAQDIAELEEAAFKAAVARIAPAVVQLETFGTQNLAGSTRDGEAGIATNISSGVFVSTEGHILSSKFTLASEPTSVIATRSDGQRSPAKVIAQDHSRSLILLKASFPEGVVVPEIVPIGEIRVGQWAIAVGRGFDAAKVNSSVGIVSALDRVWGKAIQTDAKISPNNYGGPLIDAAGRIFGILAPLSPNSQEVASGAEWYDGGIGFAVPLSEVMPQLDKLKQGKNLHPGLIGISYAAENLFGAQVEISAVSPKSPAYKAGVRKGDRIDRINDRPIQFPANLRHALGTKYAGEKIRLALIRGDQKQTFEFELAETIEPYERPRLGILPERKPASSADKEATGVLLRHVVPKSAAAVGGLTVGDIVTKLDGIETRTADRLRSAVAASEPGQTVVLEFLRGSETRTAKFELHRGSADFLTGVPVVTAPQEQPRAPATGVVEIKLPEERNACFAYVPNSYHPAVPAGLVVWLHAPDDYQRDKLVEVWKPLCDSHRIILLAPAATDPSRWQPGDASFVRRVVEQVLDNYSIDRSRVVAHGYQAGGAMAYFLATTQRDVYTGVIPVDAALPSRLRCPDNDPVYPLSILSYWNKKSQVAKSVESTHQRFQAAKYPVNAREIVGPSRYLDSEELEELVRWVDVLDQI